ncbi:MAG: amidohydrolase family protein, partial [Pseudomonadota bacterium]
HQRGWPRPGDADKTVARYQDRGVTALKLYWKLGTPEYEALSKAAAARGLNLYTHVDNGIVSINEAMSNGVRHFEHFFTLIPTAMNISAERPALKAAFGVDRPRGLDEYAAIQAFYFAHMRANAALDADLLALLDRMAANKATISLTLNNIAAAAGQSSFFTGFGPYPDRSAPQLSYRDEQRAQLKTAFLAITHYMKEAVDRGIVLRLGTDTRKGGEAALAAMIAMGENGFDMPTVFQIATINGARALGLDDDIGLVKAGHRADLVLLDASVLDDPRKLFGTKTIIKNGQVFEPKASRAEAILAQLNETRDAEAARNWAREYQDDPRFGPLQTVELETAFYSAIYAGDVTRARLTHDFVKPYLGPNDTHFPSEREINGAGYGLVNKKDMASARAVFAYNVELFPTSANVYDSLGEVCALMGDMDCAEKNYKRTLAINPDNPNAQNVLDRIKDLRTAAGS